MIYTVQKAASIGSWKSNAIKGSEAQYKIAQFRTFYKSVKWTLEKD